MAINGKIIKGFAQKNKLENGDGFLFQRDNEYFFVNASNILSGSILENTRTKVNTFKSGGNLAVGSQYYLTDKYTWVTASSENTIELDALYLARNADYQNAGVYSGITPANGFSTTATGTNLGVWNGDLTPSLGDVAIYNGLHWLNITGSNGGSDPTVDTTNWESVSNTNIDTAFTYGYIQEIDEILYDFDGDTIIRRYDKRSNDVGVTAIPTFQWGNNDVTGNTIVGATAYDNLNQTGTDKNNTLTFGESVNYATKTYELGDWNMDTSTTLEVNHGLSSTEWKTIRNPSAIIRNDSDSLYLPINSFDDIAGGTVNGGVTDFGAGTIRLKRTTGGIFDSATYDSTSYNRGWLTIQYIAD